MRDEAPVQRSISRRSSLSRGLGVAGVLGVVSWTGVFEPVVDLTAPTRIERPAPSREADAPGPLRRVLLLSIDGLAPWALAQVSAPTLERLAREGTSAERAETIVPSITLPSHASMISGLPYEAHGVDFNQWRPWRHVTVSTLFTACRRDRLRCGLVAGKRKFAHFAEGEAGVLFYEYARGAEAVFQRALARIEQDDPDFLMLHVAEVDATGHAEGWGSEAQRRAIEAVDAALGRFLALLDPSRGRPLALIVSADHGGHGTGHGSAEPDDVRIPWIAWGDGIAAGVRPPFVSTLDTGPSVLRLLGSKPLDGMQGVSRIDPGAGDAR